MLSFWVLVGTNSGCCAYDWRVRHILISKYPHRSHSKNTVVPGVREGGRLVYLRLHFSIEECKITSLDSYSLGTPH